MKCERYSKGKGGKVTAGNASQLSDGAAAVLVASRQIAEEQGWPVWAPYWITVHLVSNLHG
ncbi:MAG: hypothetical protein Ct9H90mP16_08230 [Candidatus Poseidoniales archaeon]|nr:MAG: hypothetical protein Ct9H90mP16_08230 [Candidatus Poseidoniales archaeon]